MQVIVDIEPDEILVAFKRDEGYEDVHPELFMEDVMTTPQAFEYRIIPVEGT